MISKTDLLLLLANTDNSQEQINKVLASEDIPLDVVKFINDQRELEGSKYYT